MRLWIMLFPVFALALLRIQPEPQQDAIQIVGAPDCADCHIELTLEVILRDRPDLDRPVVAHTVNVVRDSQNRILLVHGMEPAAIQVFDAEGAFITSKGGYGQGPGEFQWISALTLAENGQLYAFDGIKQTVSVFSPNLEFVEAARLSLVALDAVFTQQGLVVAARSYTPDRVGLPLHLLTPDLEIGRSFGAVDQTVRPDMPMLQSRKVTEGSNGYFWASRFNRYLIEEWEPGSGTRRRAFERIVEWFEPWHVSRGVSREEPPQPWLVGIWQDDSGFLWTTSWVAGERWQEGLYAPPGFGGDVMIDDFERVYDSYVEVIDTETGRLLASKRVPQSLSGFTNDGLIIGNRHPDDDVPEVNLWKATLRRETGNR